MKVIPNKTLILLKKDFILIIMSQRILNIIIIKIEYPTSDCNIVSW